MYKNDNLVRLLFDGINDEKLGELKKIYRNFYILNKNIILINLIINPF